MQYERVDITRWQSKEREYAYGDPATGRVVEADTAAEALPDEVGVYEVFAYPSEVERFEIRITARRMP